MPRKGESPFLPLAAGVVSFLLSAPAECNVEPTDSPLDSSSGELNLFPEQGNFRHNLTRRENAIL